MTAVLFTAVITTAYLKFAVKNVKPNTPSGKEKNFAPVAVLNLLKTIKIKYVPLA
jgi:hypothetical protein